MAALVSAATQQAQRAADAAGVQVRLLSELPDLQVAQDLFAQIWVRNFGEPLIGVEHLRAMSHAGNYVAGAYVDQRLVGACIGFFASPAGKALHSHMAGVVEGARGRHVGFALKVHQRAWSMEQGLQEIRWTFDPLVRRNAYFNLVRLGARAREYLVDFYGELDDAVNAGQGSDRLLVAWELAAPEVAAICDGQSMVAPATGGVTAALWATDDWQPQLTPTTDATMLVEVPDNIEKLRSGDPALAKQWRHAVRDVLGGAMAAGAQVTGFLRNGGYLVQQWSPGAIAGNEEGG